MVMVQKILHAAAGMLCLACAGAFLLLALAGCGGGGDDEPRLDETPAPPMCQQRPEICK